MLLATVGALAVFGPRMLTNLENVVRDGLITAGDANNASRGSVMEILRANLMELARAVAPIALVALGAGLLASVLQVRPQLTPGALKPSFKKLNPLTGMKRVFGTNALVECAKAIAKTVVVGAVTFFAVWPQLQSLGALVGLSPEALPAFTGGIVMHIATRAVLALLVIAAARLRVAALPAREVAADEQAGGQAGGEAERRRARDPPRRSAAASSRPRAAA